MAFVPHGPTMFHFRPGYQEKHRKRLMQMAKVGQMRRAKDLPTEGDKSDLRKRGRFVI